ncbi:MAG: DNA methyltransferase [Candidatus Thorarchaeota archaeon]|nr:DNA methyltransferase [Candidatus Thorarchaeota archaeon]
MTTVSDDSHDYELEFFGDISPDLTIPDLSRILIISKDQSYLTHGIHKFPAKFFPELPRYLIRRYSVKGGSVLDPMCGSGTVVLESLLSGRAAIGVDVDPMAQLITRVKTQSLPHNELDSHANDLLDWIDHTSVYPSIPEFNYRDNWFQPFVLHELGIISDAINHFSSSGLLPEFCDFFRVIFSSIIREVSNADPHCTRTVIRKKSIRKISAGETIFKFRDALTKQINAMSELTASLGMIEPKEVVLKHESATAMTIENSSIDLAVTSPPYINAVDYPRTHQLEMYWLGMIGDGPLSNMKRNYIGTETVYKREYEMLQYSSLSTLDPLLEKIFESDPRRSFIVFKFFEDMKKQLIETLRVLRPGARYCLAIGSNLIRGIPVHSHEILSEMATSSEVGFHLERSFFSGLIRHFIRIPRKERMLGEWVLILRKPEY